MPTPKRRYLIRTPRHRGKPFVGPDFCGAVRTNKRDAIRFAKMLAQSWATHTPVRNRRISVYSVIAGWRPTLLYQCHADRKTGKIVSEIL